MFCFKLLLCACLHLRIFLIRTFQCFLNQAQYKLPLRQLFSCAATFAGKILFDPLEQFFWNLKCHSSGIFHVFPSMIIVIKYID